MALTKVTGQVIKNTTDVTVGVLTVTNTLAVGGTVSIGGTLTYEDVTNVDAVGLVTARNGIVVGSGITLSKDGDGFFTGVTTATTFSGAFSGSGANITALNASNIASGTVPTARLGSGTASSSTFLRGDSTFQTVNTDLVSDTSPQLGGNLDVNTKNITFGDSSDGSSDDVLTFGAGSDLRLYHDGSNSYIKQVSSGTGNLLIFADGHEIQLIPKSGEPGIKVINDGAVELYHNGVKTAYTKSTGFEIKGGNTSDQTELQIIGNEGQDASILLGADDGDDNADYWRMYSQASDNAFTLKNYAAGSYETSIRAVGNGAVELYYDNTVHLATDANGVHVTTNVHMNDNGVLELGTSSDLQLKHDGNSKIQNVNNSCDLRIISNSIELKSQSGDEYFQKCTVDGAVAIYHDNVKKFDTISTGIRVHGSEGGDAQIQLLADEGDDNADYWRFLAGTAGQLDIANYSTGSWVNHMTINGSGYVRKPNNANFCARKTDTSSYNAQDIIIYNSVSSNFRRWDIGGNYSTSTGKFTAPIDGIYYFEAQAMSTGWSNNDLTQDLLFLNSNNGTLSYPRQRRSRFQTSDDDNGYFTNSVSGQAQLSAGDTVWVQLNRACSVTSESFSYFSGWLVQ